MEQTYRIWDIHDPHIFQDDCSGEYYVYCTGGKILHSKNLIDWAEIGNAVPDFPKEAAEWAGGTHLWAPDIIKVGKEYRLYCSASSWGVRKSCIFLAVSNKPQGPFKYRDIVIRSDDNSPCNAIDANIVTEEGTGRMFMTFGSFWGGAYMIELDPETGLAKNGQEDYGHCIASRPDWMDSAIEGPYIRYNEDFGYYYLFVSYGSLLSDYNIRVGRSKNIEGPYLDQEGRNLAVPNWNNKLDPDAINTPIDTHNVIGYLLAGSYIYENRDDRWHGIMGPGHNSVLHDRDGSWYLVHHARPLHYSHKVSSFMQVRKMFWMDGWPVVAPVAFAGDEQLAVASAGKKLYEIGRYEITKEEVSGIYRFLELKPQSPQLAIPMSELTLYPDGTAYYAKVIRFEWSIENVTEANTPGIQGTIAKLSLRSYGRSIEAYVARGYDSVLESNTLYLTGINTDGESVWGVKLP